MPAPFATTSLARRIDRTEQALVRGMAEAARAAGAADVRTWSPGGGVVMLGEPGSPFNKAIGLGFETPPSAGDWDEIERAHAERRARVQVELSTLADPALAESLTARGYRLVGFENVLARSLERLPEGPPAVDTIITVVEPPEAARWTTVLLDGFLHPDTFDGPPSHESFDRDTLARTYDAFGAVAGVERLLAWVRDQPAGGASFFLHDGIGVLCGAATLPAFRRRGVQSSLLRARLIRARERGCDLAVVTTQPGSKSQENVQRAGFELVYSRAVLVLHPEPRRPA